MSRIIELSKGYQTIVDDEDFEKYSKFKWYADVKFNGNIYAVRRVRIGLRSENKKKTIRLHREIVGAPNHIMVDHKNTDSLDNRRHNLRLASSRQNSANHDGQPKQRKYTQYKDTKKNTNCSTWCARIIFNGKELYLGSFETEKEAAIAYNEAAKKYFGEFAKLNEV